MKLLLKGGRVVDPSGNIDETRDILIKDGKIAGQAKKITAAETKDAEVIDAAGLVVAPGLIDMHTHLREPGFEYKETIRTGAQAAAAGGFTSIACMPNTDPVNDNRSVTEFIKRRASEDNIVNVYPVAAISKGSKGESLSEFWDLKEAGAVAFSDDGKPVMNGALMRRAFEYASSLGMPLISHCEDTNLSAGGVMNEGFAQMELGLRGIPAMAEEIMVNRDIMLAAYLSAALHIAHVSTAGSVRLIREAKQRGVRVSAETAPHYFTLNDEAVRSFDTNTKVNPPLRGADDIRALKEALADGTIDAIATDHAPHALTNKELEYDFAASGIIGLETSVALSLKLVEEGILTLPRLIALMSVNPAAILHLQKGTLNIGADADITVIDMNKSWQVDSSLFCSKSRNTPFAGWNLKGKAVLTIVGGAIKHREI